MQTQQIHGHEVMEMMLASGQTYTKESLTNAIVARFGKDACFFTCSAQGMSAAQLVDFLEGRGKFVPQGGGFQTSPDLMCQH